MQVRRYPIQSHVYFVTTVVVDRLPIFTCPSFVIPLFDSLNYYQYRLLIHLLGYVIMPDHVHFLIYPHGEYSVSEFMRTYKAYTAKRLVRQAMAEGRDQLVEQFRNAGHRTRRGQFKVWQDGFWDRNVWTQGFLRQKLDYIHGNPVRAGLVASAEDYPYSSYRSYHLDEDWLIEVYRDWA